MPVPEDQLPVVLPEDVQFMGVQSPIKADPEWRKTACPRCGKGAERETDTFDTFVESSWYYARYCSADADAVLDERVNYWLPIDQYIGGIEHAVMHLLYFRFWHKVMRDLGWVDSNEPARNLLCQGMVLADSFYRDTEDGGRVWIAPAEVDVKRNDRGEITAATARSDGQPVTHAGRTTMSKSKNNGVDPGALVARYGADTVRLFVMFAAPPDQALEWSDDGVEGANRFLKRVWRHVHAHMSDGPVSSGGHPDPEGRELRRKLHQTIAKVGDDIGRRYTFNTAIAALMELTNALGRYQSGGDAGRAVRHEVLENTVLMLAPIVPHISQALWEALGHSGLVAEASWPEVDESALEAEEIEMVVQVKGRLRGRITVPADAKDDDLRKAALADPNVQRFVEGETIRRVIIVPGKLVNIVV